MDYEYTRVDGDGVGAGSTSRRSTYESGANVTSAICTLYCMCFCFGGRLYCDPVTIND